MFIDFNRSINLISILVSLVLTNLVHLIILDHVVLDLLFLKDFIPTDDFINML